MQALKHLLTGIGAHLSEKSLAKADAALNYLSVGQWLRARNFVPERKYQSRQEVWEHVLKDLSDKKVLYLEFGVAYGASIGYWSKRLTHPGSILHGFDSFEGLPEEAGPWKKGQFDAKGLFPQLADRRVQFFKGWFNDVLPTYNVPSHEQLVLNLDADLYSSTSYVLRTLRPAIRKGTFIYFDEFHHIHHEPKAFAEFMNETGLRFRLLAADRTCEYTFFECLG